MKTSLLTLVLACSVMAAEDGRSQAANKPDEKIARVQKVLRETPITLTDPLGLPLDKFLEFMEGELPNGSKVALRIDQQAFGKEAASKLGSVSIKLPPLQKVHLLTILRLALKQIQAAQQIEVDLGIRPEGVVITRPPLATHLMVYDIRDLVDDVPRLLPLWKEWGVDSSQDLKSAEGPVTSLISLLTSQVAFRPWESIRVLNGTRLAVLASPIQHLNVEAVLEASRRLLDVAVVMNARLYEVDRAFFSKHVAPLFAPDKDSGEAPAILRIDRALLTKVSQHRLLVESEETKLRIGRDAPFLSEHSAFRYSAGTAKEANAGLAGVAFEARPAVSSDYRHLRLEITQRAAQLIRIDKIKIRGMGKEVEIEMPNVHRTSVSGTVKLLDGNPILMPVAYRPPGKDGEDKVWLLVARPYVWIEEEVKEQRKTGGHPAPVWDSAIQDEEEKPKP